MRKVLYILGELTDQDVEWLINFGERRDFAPGDLLIQQGRVADGLYIILDGAMVVEAPGGADIAQLGRGEMVGEMSFIEARPPSVNVKANKPTQVLAIPRKQLQRQLEKDPGFASRFYRALAMFLSYRLRGTTEQLGYGDTRERDRDDDPDELDANVLDNVYMAGTRFERMMNRLMNNT